MTAFMAYLFLVLHLRMNRYAERWLLFRYCDMRSKQSRKSAVRMYVRTWDSISFDAVEQTISFLLRLFAEPPPPQSMQFSLLQSFARMLQASGCPFQQTFQVGACCFQVPETALMCGCFQSMTFLDPHDCHMKHTSGFTVQMWTAPSGCWLLAE